MGVTIHFEGQVRDEENYEKLLAEVVAFADNYGMEYSEIDDQIRTLSRVKDEKDWDYTGPVKGIKIILHENCDPLNLEFDKDLYIQEYVKTQFVGAEAHIILVELLRDFQKYFSSFQVEDEGEYWETNDKSVLEDHISTVDKLIDERLAEDPNLTGPVRSPSGRILDLVTRG